ncbi:NAD(P)/FAD-dependent oxidoreductase [Mahella sp.]|uniref:NAD(P)/FAD-dependent oxidoreductase n=1 Tax=Mahella sp. TaxID=2798721 RepID=UPI0025C54625|nr:NAD(P)/FAD-dependent oxidoreductase [Mahella sp.]MBZ4665283.1 FAD-dependent pyridine nucleotide-disulfide oxidoreductase [Mahella sp.]MDK2902474.1 hypothetical protein [Clostridiales bacterium]
MAQKRIVILGAGFGGLTAAKAIHKYLKNDQDVDILMVNQSPYHVYLTELHEVAGSRVSEEGILVPIEHVLEHTKVRFAQDTIKKVDVDNHKLISDQAEYPFDYLIVACGSQPTYFGIPGMKENALTLWSLDDAKKIHQHVLDVFEQAAKEKDPAKRKELLTFVVGGGGFTGVEMMGELRQWTETLCKQYGIPKEERTLIIVEALPKILPNLPDSLIEKAKNYMTKKGIKIMTDSPITEVEPGVIHLKSGEAIKAGTFIWTGGVEAKDFVKNIGLKTGKRGRIEVNKYMQSVDDPNIYVIGDDAYFVTEHGEMPALVESAMESAECACYNIAADIHGQPKKEFKLELRGVMVSIGSTYAVANVMNMKMSGVFALLMKHLVNLNFLFGVGGIESIVKYIKYHFFQSNRGRPMIIKHMTVKSQTFWLSLIRFFLGLLWITEGITKVQDGWLSGYAKIGDVGSGASLQLVGPSTPGWYAWIAEHIIYPNAIFFQSLIVLTELALGLMFIFGFLTFIGGVISAFMSINFMLSASASAGAAVTPSLLNPGNLWILVLSIAMLGGAGRAFGLDYYFIPYLKELIRYYQRNHRLTLIPLIKHVLKEDK